MKNLDNFTSGLKNSSLFPVLFLGHGNPMNAIEENEFVQGFRNVAHEMEKPQAILCISAHWETQGTWVTAMDKPTTIHDFGGFPKELYEVQYPAPGDPDLATSIKNHLINEHIELDHRWGLDHGAWSVIKHMYPDADVPVLQLSLDHSKTAQQHYDLGRKLSFLREKGVLIIGSGNMVHNLRKVAWHRLNESDYGFDWAIEANDKMKSFITDGNHQSLVDYRSQGAAFHMAIPTPEHYLPLLYTLALQSGRDEINFFNDKAVGGSLTMTSLQLS